ncbi:hypothetical protein [Chelatococcus reniformis]|uniref:Transmembrane protein n=1 Tax=Chelatococcus reniformis TaxID=1494448 RepID=A0A916TYM5_9HYPH|nr:hypothetical protein [Chelatococcus reniformis]GGC51144.1 hypothetical protein GCM10010994_07860 [Chelatococcus reniformis]
MRRLLKPLWFLLAVLFLIEAWFWDHLQPVFAWIGRVVPWQRVRRALEEAVRHLPPYAALVLFAVPLALVEPMKLLALWHLAEGRLITAVIIFAVAQILALGLSVFLFDLVKPKLLSIAWFARLYAWVIRLKDWAHAQVEPVKRQLAAMVRALRLDSGRFARRWSLLRKRARAASVRNS